MTAPNWVSWIENTLLVPGSPESMALTTQSTSPDVRFVRAVPQTKRVPVGWWSMPAPTLSKKYAVMRVHRSEEHTSELQSQSNLVCRLLLDTKKLLHLRQLAHPPSPAS